MNRRETLAALLALGASIGSRRAEAQAPRAGKPFRIGVIPDLPAARLEHIKAAMRELGWVADRDYVLIQSGIQMGGDVDLSVKRVVDAKPDLIFGANTAYILAAHRLTKTIPIVMWASGFPVEAGLAHSLARPGKNVTGLSIYAGTEILGKLLQLLREAKPGIKRIGVLWSYVPPAHPREEIEPAYEQIRKAARLLGLDVRILEVAKPDQTAAVLDVIGKEGIEALLLTSGVPLVPHRQKVMKFALERRLPTIVDFTWLGIEPQPLLRYSPSPVALVRLAAVYVDKILRGGANPADMPIQQPAKFELVVDLRTAKAIGLTLPQSLLLRADEVIE